MLIRNKLLKILIKPIIISVMLCRSEFKMDI
jgi:hypothetical protein